MSQFESFRPLAFAAAQAAIKDAQNEKSDRAFRAVDLVALAAADPHVVTRGSGFTRDGGQLPTKNRLSPYKPGVAEQSKWDWYQTTVAVEDPGSSGLVNCLLRAWEFSDFVPAKNLNGYHYGGQITRGDRVLCHLCWGGQAGVNLKTTSDESHVLASAMADFGVEHLPTRVDSCLDWEEDGLFDSLATALIKFAQLGKGLAINQQGDWTRGIGRTLYLGSPSSPVRLVLYEKGYEQGGDAPLNWVRLEARVRPKKEHRAEVASWSPEHAFAAGWIAAACKHIGLDDLEKRAVGTIWKRTDDEKTRWAMLRQYGSALRKWLAECGGDREEFGRRLADALREETTGGAHDAAGNPAGCQEREVQHAANERADSGAESGADRGRGSVGRTVWRGVQESGEQRGVPGESRSSERSGQSDLRPDDAHQPRRHTTPSVAGRGEDAQRRAGRAGKGTEGIGGRSGRNDGRAESGHRSSDFDRPADAGDVQGIGGSPHREGSPHATNTQQV